MEPTLPIHIQELTQALSKCSDCESVLLSYLHYLPCDPYLHSLYLSLSYDSLTSSFTSLPPLADILETILSEYSPLHLPLKRSYSESSETSSEKTRCNKGLKILSARVKSILIEKRPTSYRQVAEELIREMSSISKSEEKNILRRVYDSLNVLIAAGVVVKEGREYCWRSGSNTRVDGKKEKLRELADKLTAVKALITRNLQKQKQTEECLAFPLMFIATSEDQNKIVIESNQDCSTVRIKFRKTIKIFQESQILTNFAFLSKEQEVVF